MNVHQVKDRWSFLLTQPSLLCLYLLLYKPIFFKGIVIPLGVLRNLWKHFYWGHSWHLVGRWQRFQTFCNAGPAKWKIFPGPTWLLNVWPDIHTGEDLALLTWFYNIGVSKLVSVGQIHSTTRKQPYPFILYHLQLLSSYQGRVTGIWERDIWTPTSKIFTIWLFYRKSLLTPVLAQSILYINTKDFFFRILTYIKLCRNATLCVQLQTYCTIIYSFLIKYFTIFNNKQLILNINIQLYYAENKKKRWDGWKS